MSQAENPLFWRRLAEVHDRFFWLDGDPNSDWAGTTSWYGWLQPDDVSLTYDARSRSVTRHCATGSTVIGSDIFVALREEMARPDAPERWFGYFGYACNGRLAARTGGAYPDAVWMGPSSVRVVPTPPTSMQGEWSLTGACSALRPSAAANDISAREKWYQDAFEAVSEHLRAGDTYEVNLTYNETVSAIRPSMDAYLRLRRANPAPYSAYLQHRVTNYEATMLSTSPERFLKISNGRTVSSKPMKGTMPRDPDPVVDRDLRAALASDARFLAENLMIIDLVRNDLATICEMGSVRTASLMRTESYAHVHQLVSEVVGDLCEEVDVIDAVEALFPPGSMTGAPKKRTMEIIRDVERAPRGAYAGVHGWIGSQGNADLGVTIRTAVQDARSVIQVGTGGAITVHSRKESEREEAELKVAALMSSLTGAD